MRPCLLSQVWFTTYACRIISLTINKCMAYNCTTLATSSYGDHWRKLRRIFTLEVLSSNQLNMSTGIRKDEIKILLRKLYHISGYEFSKIDLRPLFSGLTFNITRMISGKGYYGEEVAGTEQAKQFGELIEEVFSYAGVSYAGEFLPIFQHRRSRRDSESGNSMIDHLLSLQESQPECYTDETIKGLALSIVTAGSHTSAITMEWAMSNLLNHPDVLKKVGAELDAFLGSRQLLDETDLPKLQYLENTIAETLRL
ncbi:isoflavone 3'-hydroxylase-like [Durio zibethinus]|uniref:Isoflavone 3'-hydroxylase-like n=1 Tax=Durio zibethinus TaxID=66656 RepID=A0A6P6BAK3_DURZI|nr:isoflavone 3'-hydroxylase-like [Durio zibethinus]